ncbi:unnamed protein product [Schistosoma mattheei]|uniref:Uncharacterized protein n=1 Tax=Schistosoma mattheei TaxID=31246 RepID=A0AA85AXG8_9TREM|nr:unnamed protein product [Schistosoma mattheei]
MVRQHVDVIREFPEHPEKYVFKYSSINLSSSQMQVLSLCPKFCNSTSKTNRLHTQMQFENLSNQTHDHVPTSPQDLQHFKSTLVDCSHGYINIQCGKNNLLTKNHLDQLMLLKTNKNLIPNKPYKGTGVVLLDRQEYLDKMRLILEDVTKFSKPKGGVDKTLQIEKQLTDVVKNLKNKRIITPDLYDHILPMGSIIPRLYGLPKAHKPGLPSRPILDMSSSSYHRIAQWLAEKLEPVRRQVSKYSILFIDRIKEVSTSGKQMFSLDVNSVH